MEPAFITKSRKSVLIRDKGAVGKNQADKHKSIAKNMPTRDIAEIAQARNELEKLEIDEVQKNRTLVKTIQKGQPEESSNENLAKIELAERNKRYQEKVQEIKKNITENVDFLDQDQVNLIFQRKQESSSQMFW